MHYATVGDDSGWMIGSTLFLLALLAVLAACCYLLRRWDQNSELDAEQLAELKQLTSTPSVAALVRAALEKRGRVRVADLEKARAEAWRQEWLHAEQALKASVGFGATK